MPYGFGPMGPRASLVRPSVSSDPYGAQTWFKDASAPGAKDGTVIPASWLNSLIGERRNLVAAAGLNINSNLPQDSIITEAVRAIANARAAAATTGAALIAKLDTAIGPGWRTAMTGSQIVDAIDTVLGDADWRSFNPDAYWRKDMDIVSPQMVGTPTAPTAAPGTNTTQVATTAFVTAAGGSYAPLASPAFTGVPTAPTAALGTNTTQIATMAAVKAAIDALVGAAPGALDTLDELAAALADDASYAASITTALAGKQPLHANLTGLAALADPNADRIAFWDDSAGAFAWLELGTNLSITGTTLNASGGGGGYSGGDLTSAAGVIAGTEGAPGLYFVGDTDTGLHSPGANILGIVTQGALRWKVDPSGHLLAEDTNTYDIGSSGGNKPRSIYAAGTVYAANHVQTTNAYLWANGTNFQAPSDGVITAYNNGNTSFGRMQFGGTTSSFPALKRSSATLQARLADDSAFAEFKASILEAGTSVKFPDATTQTTAAVQDVRLGTQASIGLTDASAGNVITGVTTTYNSTVDAQLVSGLHCKPVQKNVGGSWTTITG